MKCNAAKAYLKSNGLDNNTNQVYFGSRPHVNSKVESKIYRKIIGNFLLANSRFYTRFGLGGEAGINEYNPLRDVTLAGDISYFKTDK